MSTREMTRRVLEAGEDAGGVGKMPLVDEKESLTPWIRYLPTDWMHSPPREVFADALADRASAVIVAHNHPAGSLEPSAADVEVTVQLKAAGTVMGISLLDHIVFNRSGYFSFLESGRL